MTDLQSLVGATYDGLADVLAGDTLSAASAELVALLGGRTLPDGWALQRVGE